MTREETISTLRSLIAFHTLRYDEWQAVEVAIKALKEQGEREKEKAFAEHLRDRGY